MLRFRVAFLILFCCLYRIAFGQTFSGSIFFSFEVSGYSQEIIEKTNDIFGDSFWDNVLLTRHEYHINEDSLLFIAEGPIKTVAIMRQIGGIGTIDIPNTSFYRPFEEDPGFIMKNLVLKKRTKEQREILGFVCRKYIYESRSRGFILEAWITDCFPFDPDSQTSKYFANIFNENGLMLEQTRRWEVATQTMKVEKIVFESTLAPDIRALLLR